MCLFVRFKPVLSYASTQDSPAFKEFMEKIDKSKVNVKESNPQCTAKKKTLLYDTAGKTQDDFNNFMSQFQSMIKDNRELSMILFNEANDKESRQNIHIDPKMFKTVAEVTYEKPVVKDDGVSKSCKLVDHKYGQDDVQEMGCCCKVINQMTSQFCNSKKEAMYAKNRMSYRKTKASHGDEENSQQDTQQGGQQAHKQDVVVQQPQKGILSQSSYNVEDDDVDDGDDNTSAHSENIGSEQLD